MSRRIRIEDQENILTHVHQRLSEYSALVEASVRFLVALERKRDISTGQDASAIQEVILEYAQMLHQQHVDIELVRKSLQ